MFGPKSPAERAAPRDSVISWGDFKQREGLVNGEFGPECPDVQGTKHLGLVEGLVETLSVEG